MDDTSRQIAEKSLRDFIGIFTEQLNNVAKAYSLKKLADIMVLTEDVASKIQSEHLRDEALKKVKDMTSHIVETCSKLEFSNADAFRSELDAIINFPEQPYRASDIHMRTISLYVMVERLYNAVEGASRKIIEQLNDMAFKIGVPQELLTVINGEVDSALKDIRSYTDALDRKHFAFLEELREKEPTLAN